MWEVVRQIDKRYDWCRCSCGREKSVRRDHRKAGLSTQCPTCNGYYRQRDYEVKPEPRIKAVYTEEERTIRFVVKEAKYRCTNPKHKHYEDYGGRGILFNFNSVEEGVKWIIANLGPRPEGLTLERVNNYKGYEPGNLKWATQSEQLRNRRSCKTRMDQIRSSL